MSRENVEIVYRAYEAVRRHDPDAFVAEAHPEIEAMSHLMDAEGTVYRGHAGLRQFLEDIYAVFPEWHPEVASAMDHGDTVLAEIRMAGTGAASGLSLEQTVWQVIKFRNGKAIWFRGYGSHAEALEAAGLSE